MWLKVRFDPLGRVAGNPQQGVQPRLTLVPLRCNLAWRLFLAHGHARQLGHAMGSRNCMDAAGPRPSQPQHPCHAWPPLPPHQPSSSAPATAPPATTPSLPSGKLSIPQTHLQPPKLYPQVPPLLGPHHGPPRGAHPLLPGRGPLLCPARGTADRLRLGWHPLVRLCRQGSGLCSGREPSGLDGHDHAPGHEHARPPRSEAPWATTRACRANTCCGSRIRPRGTLRGLIACTKDGGGTRAR